MNTSENLGRIRWKCRRGMLELDLMLLKFFNEKFVSLSAEEKQQFEALLEQPDPVLQEYLYGLAIPEDPALQKIIAKIRGLG
ncbi:MAG TPA: succinate dehydrogenase assembly factor 2 [Coxiellaceae bacterium]|nr:succinate dehydrogenase assembly factor 2 [Coxiellaceae bacterium]